MSGVRVPEVFVEKVRARVDMEDTDIFETCRLLAIGWEEMGDLLTEDKASEMGWKEGEKRRKAHAWFIESLSAEINKSPASMYDRKRVGVNILLRGLRQENMSYSVCTELLRNCNSTADQIISEEEVKERIDWFNGETDKFAGKPPSPRDIKKHFRRNGERKEWEILLQAVERNAKELNQSEGAPIRLRGFMSYVLRMLNRGRELNWSGADATSTGGEQKPQTSVPTADGMEV